MEKILWKFHTNISITLRQFKKKKKFFFNFRTILNILFNFIKILYIAKEIGKVVRGFRTDTDKFLTLINSYKFFNYLTDFLSNFYQLSDPFSSIIFKKNLQLSLRSASSFSQNCFKLLSKLVYGCFASVHELPRKSDIMTKELLFFYFVLLIIFDLRLQKMVITQ